MMAVYPIFASEYRTRLLSLAKLVLLLEFKFVCGLMDEWVVAWAKVWSMTDYICIFFILTLFPRKYAVFTYARGSFVVEIVSSVG
jgi:hypothetical protein